MGKYDPLTYYLRRQRQPIVELSFRSIEGKLGYMLPNIASRPEWWCCGDGMPGAGEVQKAAWRAAGYEATLLSGDLVRFERLGKTVAGDHGSKPKAI